MAVEQIPKGKLGSQRMIQSSCIPISGGKFRSEVVAAREAGMLAGTRASEPSASWRAYHADQVSSGGQATVDCG